MHSPGSLEQSFSRLMVPVGQMSSQSLHLLQLSPTLRRISETLLIIP
jgi:hypothetical protein